ncbi:MAG: metal ABC transporter permease [Gemmatales bacterium]|nr:metal ABC transporter permease [Gemmatales bacterium]MDW8222893.1 metal ABC transporter permease [Gemmatales bacterium]
MRLRAWLSLAALVLLISLTCFESRLGWLSRWGERVDQAILQLRDRSQERYGLDAITSHPAQVKGLIGVTLVSLICGAASALVISNRMAFFSDALAHCAIAGVSLGLIMNLLGWITGEEGILTVMTLLGAAVGLGIAVVREKTALANDTVIGVFFAGAMGLGAVLIKGISAARVRGFSPENFLFGEPLAIAGADLVHFVLLLAGVLLFLWWLYNPLVFISFNPSLAHARGISVRLVQYLFIVLLAFVVNYCVKVVGALLINAMLIFPAATALNVARNLRQYFWLAIATALLAGPGGTLLSYLVVLEVGKVRIALGSGGVMVVVGVILFFTSMFLGRYIRGPRPVVTSH